VYRLDFVLTAGDASAPATTTFTLNLPERDKGEMLVGRNVPLTTPIGAAGSGAPASVGAPIFPRQDVGIKVGVVCRTLGEDVLLEVTTDVSASEPPSVRKALLVGSALAPLGKSTLVATLDDDRRKVQLFVTATRLR
jgi:hypothetical protein